MVITVLLAQLFGLVLLVKGLFILLRPDLVKEMIKEVEKSALYTYTAGMFATVLGAILVLMHGAWGSTIEVLVSILAWGTLLKGILAVFAPKALLDIAKPFLKNDTDMRGLAIVVILIAAFLLFKGFGL